jgi:hypothetical protein
MKRKYKKTKKGHARRNATIKRKKRTRRQRGGATVIVRNTDVPDHVARNGQDYNIIQVEYDDDDSIQQVFVGTARANIIFQTCGAMVHPPSGRVGEPRCDIVSYQPVNGTLAFYNPDKTIRLTYEGDFTDGRMHGHGKMTFNTHPVFQEYEGDFEHGMMHGRGTMVMKNGDRYVGGFQGDMMHGLGKMTFNTHPVFQEYEGGFEHGMMHGRGTMVMKNGDRYVGNFQEDMMHGTGTMTFQADHSRYEGDWDQGRMHGVGDVYDNTGNLVFKARFENNMPIERIEEEEEEEEEMEEEESAPAPALFGNPANIFQNPQQNTEQNIFGRRPGFFDPQ